MTKAELIGKIAEETESNKKEVAHIVDAFVAEIKEGIKNNEKVNLVGFASFEPKLNKARNGINPATKEKIKIAESNSIKFKVSKSFKEELNK